MKLQLVRHATLWLEYAGMRLLVDPMLSDAGVNPPIAGSTNERRNPLVPLPAAADSWLRPDAVIVTHLHRDHWDDAAAQALPKELALYCQPGDEETLRAAGFAAAIAIDPSASLGHASIARTDGQHGTGEIGRRMGRVSGFVLRAADEPTLYVAGDTIWCDDVRRAIDAHKPDVIVVNAGGARFAQGDPITMDTDDVASVCRYAPGARIVAVHMDAINHCLTTRELLRGRLSAEGLLDRVAVPADGEWIAE